MAAHPKAFGSPPNFGPEVIGGPVDIALVYLQGRFTRAWRVSDAAQLVRVSHSHLGRLFKRKTGESMRRYAVSMRMQAACQLLRTSSLSIKEISAAVGYASTSTFDHRFCRHFGTSPTRWRAAARRGRVEHHRG